MSNVIDLPTPEPEQPVNRLSLEDMDGGPIPLGFDRDNRNYYMSKERGTVFCMTAQQHVEANFCNLASLGWYRAHFRSKEGVPWKSVAETFFRLSSQAGLYDHERLRGRGVHIDSGQIVLNLGDELRAEDRTYSPGISPVIGSNAIYCRGVKLHMPSAKPLTNAEANKFFSLLDECSWQTSDMAPLIAGWAVIAPFCGALAFRPYLWLTGESGSGKNWILTNLIKPVMANFLICSTLDTTAAGARRHLKLDALPFWINEAESETEKSAEAIAAIIRLARGSSDGDAATIMGDGANGSSNIFLIRSMFLFSSTVHSLSATADINRTIHVALAKNQNIEWFSDFRKRVRALMTPEYSARFMARSFHLLPVILHNIEMLTQALGDELLNGRIADTLAPMLAGYAALRGQSRLTAEQAVDLVHSREWVRHAADNVKEQAAPEYDKALDHLLTRLIGHTPGNLKSVSEWIALVMKESPETALTDNRALLFRHGIAVELYGEHAHALLCRRHPQLDRMFNQTPWADGRWGRTISQNEQIKEGRKMKFGGTSPKRTLNIPRNLMCGD